MDIYYGGVIWTNHALQKLKTRGISQRDAWDTWRYPDQSKYAKSRGAWIYLKTFRQRKIEVVAKKNEKKEWLILSVWTKDVYPQGSNYKFSFWKFLLKILGLK